MKNLENLSHQELVELATAVQIAEKRKILPAPLNKSYAEFQRRYFDDPVGFANDCILWKDDKHKVASYQAKAMNSFNDKRRVSVRAPHGVGKTALAALIILWFALTRDGRDWKIPTTASAWRQLEKYLWPEVHKWARRIDWAKVGREPFKLNTELLSLSLKLKTGEAFAVASDNSDLIEGAHADNLLYVFDESKSILEATWDAAEGAFSTGDCLWLSISTPGEPIGRFYQIQSHATGYDDWATVHISKEEAIGEGRMKTEWAEQRRQQWGQESAVYQNRVEGNFATASEDGVISLSSVERAIERWNKRNDADAWDELIRIAVDVGRGGDPSVLGRRHGNAVKSLEEFHEHDVMPITGRITGILQANPQVDAVVDVIGIGAGVVDRAREVLGVAYRIIPFNASAKTDAKDKTREFSFVNLRAEAWWTVRELLNDDLIDLPDDEDLIGELTAPRWRVMSGGRIQIEAKGDSIEDGNVKQGIKARLGRSTNKADVVIQLFSSKGVGVKDEELEHIKNDTPDYSKLPADLIEAARLSGMNVEELIKLSKGQ